MTSRCWYLYEYPFAINYMLYYFFQRGPSVAWNENKRERKLLEIDS